ncbi:putative WRKY transcription factor 75 isoform X1 [Bidens hawaiensis]|uniref:putative WRKY transcription factor 75 isoform X1 n=1 Tax=Bidens hawaiensis TaxID=980011 RepID=UPI00404A7A33
MEGDEHASQAPMNDNMVNMNNNINPYMLDYMSGTTPMINNPMFQYPPSSSSPVLPQLPVSMNDHLDHNNSNMNNNSLESSNVDWVSLLSGFMHGDQGSTMGRRVSEGDEKINALRLSEKSMKSGRGKKVTPSRVAFHTRSSEDILDDGYKWRKYGQKSVKNSQHPRSYYRCTRHTCNVKKQIQRLAKDDSIVVTTYEGVHNHPCEKLMETLAPLLKQLQFLSQF